jgi:hypothetical protein
MTDLTYVGQNNSEFVINPVTGKAKISNKGASALLKVSETTIRNYREKLNIEGETVRYSAGNSVQRSNLLYRPYCSFRVSRLLTSTF